MVSGLWPLIVVAGVAALPQRDIIPREKKGERERERERGERMPVK